MAMDATVKWDHGLTFSGTGGTSGFTLPLGGAPEEGGDADGFRPMELVLIGLASCTAMDVISILKKKRQDVTGFEVKAHGERAAEHPKKFTAITLEYVVRGRSVDPAAVARSIELSETKYCSAMATLAPGVKITHTHRVLEAEQAGG